MASEPRKSCLWLTCCWVDAWQVYTTFQHVQRWPHVMYMAEFPPAYASVGFRVEEAAQKGYNPASQASRVPWALRGHHMFLERFMEAASDGS